MKKVNGTDSEYIPVSTGLQSDDDDLKNNQNGDYEGLKSSTKTKEAEASLENGKAVPNAEELVPMTPLRKFCFVLSILQCGLFIVAFGYLIPCQIPRYYDNSIQTWSYEPKDIDITTNMALAPVSTKQSFLLFGFSSPTNNTVYGIRAIDALTGEEKWTANTLGVPSAVDCDGKLLIPLSEGHTAMACLVTNQNGNLLAINQEDGHLIWTMHTHLGGAPLVKEMSKPIFVDDFDNDTVVDVVVSGTISVEGKAAQVLYLVSGTNGTISSRITLSACTSLPSLVLWKNTKVPTETKIVVNCPDALGFENVWAGTSEQLFQNSSGTTDENSLDRLQSWEKGDSLSKAMVVRSAEEAENFLILVSNKGSIIRLASSDPKRTSWHESLPAGSKFKDIIDGTFLNASDESLAVLYEEASGNSMITFFELKTGAQQKNITYSGSLATYLYSASNGIGEADTLLIKNQQGEINGTTSEPEEIFALDCKENVTFTSIWKAPKAVKGEDDRKDIVNTRGSVVIGDLNSSGKQLAIIAYHISVPHEGSSDTVGTKVELNRLYSNLPVKCKTCGC